MLAYWFGAGVVVFLVGTLTLGREARRLDSLVPRVIYKVEDAVQVVSDSLPLKSQSRLSFADLSEILRLHINLLHSLGLVDIDLIDRRQRIDDDLMIDEQEVIALILGAAEKESVGNFDDGDVAAVVLAHSEYLKAIGAIAPTLNS